MSAGGEGHEPDQAFARVKSFLLGQGVDEARIDEAAEQDQLDVLVADAVVLPGSDRYTGAELADLAGMPVELTHALWRALGFPDVDPAEAAFTTTDLDALTIAHGLLVLGVTDEASAIQLARVVGLSMAHIAEAEVSSASLLTEGLDSLTKADLYVVTFGAAIASIGRLLELVWRRHLQAVLRRDALMRLSAPSGDGGAGAPDVAIGFADLVGFTARSQQLSESALAQLVDRFEAMAHDTVVSAGGRVVKMIGDEVMFSVVGPDVAVEVGLAMAEVSAADELLPDVRVGIAAGPALARDGDFFGPTVNLASRIVNVAFPGTVVVAQGVHDHLAADPRYEWRNLRTRYLRDIGKVSLWAVDHKEVDVALTDKARRLGQAQVETMLPDQLREALEKAAKAASRRSDRGHRHR